MRALVHGGKDFWEFYGNDPPLNYPPVEGFQTLNPKSQILDPKPYTIDPEPLAPNPKPRNAGFDVSYSLNS